VVHIRTPDFSATCGWAGCTSGPWAGGGIFGEPVPLEVTRFRLDVGAHVDRIQLGGTEAMIYVIAGSGTAAASPPAERFALGTESVLWLGACEELSCEAGRDGLDLLLAETTDPGAAEPPGSARPRPRDEGTGPWATGGFQGGRPPWLALRKVFAADELPHLVSTRDTRDRLDLVTENVPVGARAIRADRIIYHPGDTAAAHYHTDCHHVFCVLAGSGLLYDGEHAHRLDAGDSALVGPGEVHWFENDTGENFSFVEFWAPPPTETIWTVTGDRCTWAPAG
jgi:mannose-6-phosphate isomerase-like protein (cupin superfamily)